MTLLTPEEYEAIKTRGDNFMDTTRYADELALRRHIEALEQKNQELREALEQAKHNLDVCYSDSHFLRSAWFRENGHPAVSDTVDNIRKWSGANRNQITKALSKTP